MLGEPNGGRVAQRRAATLAQLLDVAWELADRDGLGGFSLRDVAKTLGMQPPSLYSYVASKNDLYDLMFRQAYVELLAEMHDLPDDPEQALREGCRRAFRYCTSRPARFTLIFLRTLPGFEPSQESFAQALELYARFTAIVNDLGIDDQAHLDLHTALLSGLMSQQIANDPGGDRWERLLDEALDMFLTHTRPTSRRSRR